MKANFIRLFLIISLLYPIACSTISSDPRSVQQSEARLDEQFESLESIIQKANQSEKRVSSWSTYEHVEHILLVNRSIAKMLRKKERPEEIQERDKMAIFKTLRLGGIDRGTVQAPKEVSPRGMNRKQLKNFVANVRSSYQRLNYQDFVDTTFVPGNHPHLGGLTFIEWLRFAEVHTKHHLKIIEEIEDYGLVTQTRG